MELMGVTYFSPFQNVESITNEIFNVKYVVFPTDNLSCRK